MSELQDEPVGCHRCGHGYAQHRPACTPDGPGSCDCVAFRWVDPSPAPDLLGYHRPLVV